MTITNCPKCNATAGRRVCGNTVSCDNCGYIFNPPAVLSLPNIPVKISSGVKRRNEKQKGIRIGEKR